MDPPETPTPIGRHTSIPRLSRLPVPQSHLPVPKSTPGLRPSASREGLSGRTSSGLAVPRLRSAPSKDNLPRLRNTPSKDNLALRGRTLSSNIQEQEDSRDLVSHKPQQPSLLSRGPVRNGINTSSKKSIVPPQASHMPPPARDLDYDAAVYGTEMVADEDYGEADKSRSRASRPSLSERTMETLAQIPASPALRKRGSSFYENTTSSLRPTSSSMNSTRSRSDNHSGPISKLTLGSRPGTGYSQDGSLGPPSSRSFNSRPTSSTGEGGTSMPVPLRTLSRTATTFSDQQDDTYSEEQDTTYTGAGAANSTSSKLTSPGFYSSRQRSPSPMKPTSKGNTSTVATRTLKSQRSFNGMSNKPAVVSSDIIDAHANQRKDSGAHSSTTAKRTVVPPKTKSTTSTRSAKSSSNHSSDNPTSPKKTSGVQTSSILREQIAKAKAAKRAQMSKQTTGNAVNDHSHSVVTPHDTFDLGLTDDPFNQLAGQGGSKGLLRKRIDAARTDGRLNIAAMGLKEIPDEVMTMYDAGADGIDGSWAEMVDLTRFIAADNEFEVIGDNVFPDVDPETAMELDDWKGNQFGGLEALDLHGNILKSIPLGLRRLEMLTILNLSNNKLANDVFDVICLVPSIRDLKIGVNNLISQLPASITKLEDLETLDLQRNRLTSLPDGLKKLKRLRSINIAENTFTSLPFDILQHLPLIQLFAAKNKLDGTLIDSSVTSMSQLQTLDITGNALKSIYEGDKLELPALHQLSCSANRLRSLPDMTSWLSLMTIAAEDNSIVALPKGFITLPKIKNVDFTGNDIKIIEDDIGNMESLDIFRISGNPLREKKLAGMSTEVLKRTLKARLEPMEPDEPIVPYSDDEQGIQPSSTSSGPSTWPVVANRLDRSNTQSRTLNPVLVSEIAANHTVRVLELHHNMFKQIPTSAAFFASSLTTLVLSHNELTRDEYLDEEITLPALQTLNLSSNTISDLRPLQRLQAPNLTSLDLSFNRMISLPVLRTQFPLLEILLVSNNMIRELGPEVVRGLKIIDCSSNDLQTLNPRLGTLGEEGLKQLLVTGNRFRVPRWDVLEKGTEATLSWLRDRIPVGEV